MEVEGGNWSVVGVRQSGVGRGGERKGAAANSGALSPCGRALPTQLGAWSVECTLKLELGLLPGGGTLLRDEGEGDGLGLGGEHGGEAGDTGDALFDGEWLKSPPPGGARLEERGRGGSHTVKGDGSDAVAEGG